MSRRQKAGNGGNSSHRKNGTDPFEARINAIIASSRPAPGPVQTEVHAALDRLGAIFRVDRPLLDALKSELSIRLLTAESPDFYAFRPGKRPERVLLLNFAERDGRIQVHPAAVHEECAHALRGLFHPRENPMIQEFFGALAPILALDERRRGHALPFEAVETLLEMRGDPSRLEDIPDALAARLGRFLPPGAPAVPESREAKALIIASFREHAASHLLPALVARSMADTGHLSELLAGTSLLTLPAKEIAAMLTEYGRKCAVDPAWEERFKGYRKVCGYYLKPENDPNEAPP